MYRNEKGLGLAEMALEDGGSRRENTCKFWKAVKKGGGVSVPKCDASCHNIFEETKCRIEKNIL